MTTPNHGLFWLSSYPKSGNTWFRVFLANVLYGSKQGLNLNKVDHHINDEISASRTWVDEICGFNSALLNDTELEKLLPSIYRWHHLNQKEVSYHKIHQAFVHVNPNEPLIPPEGCLGAIYFVRNPLDIAISLANHFGFSIDEGIDMLADETYILRHFSLRQHLLSWSMHVNSWLDSVTQGMNCLFLRYEDMLYNPIESFTQAIQFLQLQVSHETIQHAIRHSQFKTLQQFEKDNGFMDKPPQLKQFFRKGIAGDWQQTLTTAQIDRVIHSHASVMQKFNYLDPSGRPVCY